MSHKVPLVRVLTAATGNSTPITLGAAYSQLFMLPSEAGAMDGRTYTYNIVDGNNWEIGRGVYTASGTTLARTTILASRISGTLGTSRISLSGTAQVRFIETAYDMDGVRGTRAVTGTTDTLNNSDLGYVVTYSNAAAVAVSLAQASVSNLFTDGWAAWVQNLGAGAVTVTPATSTINGAATLVLAQNMGAFIWSDGTNYRAYFIPVTKPLLAVNNLSDVVAATARTNLGATTVGAAVFTAADAQTARGLLQIVVPPQGRLTLQTGAPVMTTSQSAKTTIYYTPYVGNQVPIYDGTNMVPTGFSEVSIATTDTTKNPAAIGASKVNDWFVWNDGGTIRLSHGPDWTNDTTRSAGTALVRVNGVLLNNASITNGPAASRGTYVGTTRSNASSQLDWIYPTIGASGGTAGFFGVWNMYNRRSVTGIGGDNGGSWNVASSTVGPLNTMTSNRTSFVYGLAEDEASAVVTYLGTAGASGNVGVAVGYDSTTAISGISQTNGSTTAAAPTYGSFSTTPIGFHFMQALEVNAGASGGTIYGSAGIATYIQGGMVVNLRM
jgi:hypothetical protein